MRPRLQLRHPLGPVCVAMLSAWARVALAQDSASTAAVAPEPASSAPPAATSAAPLTPPVVNLPDPAAEARALQSSARDAAKAELEDAKTRVRDTANQEIADAKGRIRETAEELKQTAIERARVETDIFKFGIFPNSAGFMDARAHARLAYAEHLSSGLYLDYTTARAVAQAESSSRLERLVREYRAELDAIKGIILIHQGGGWSWSVEPGANGKLIYQDIQDSGFQTNSFSETVFRSNDVAVAQWVTSAKLDSTLVVGEHFTFDLSSEYLPYIYQRESGTSVNSQFDNPVDFSISNRTQGFQVKLDLMLETTHAGRYTLTGKAYKTQGEVASRSSLINGNFEYTFDTFDKASREDYWLELTHTASYIPWFGTLAPAIALAVQQKRITTADNTLQAQTFKVGFLLEWL